MCPVFVQSLNIGILRYGIHISVQCDFVPYYADGFDLVFTSGRFYFVPGTPFALPVWAEETGYIFMSRGGLNIYLKNLSYLLLPIVWLYIPLDYLCGVNDRIAEL